MFTDIQSQNVIINHFRVSNSTGMGVQRLEENIMDPSNLELPKTTYLTRNLNFV